VDSFYVPNGATLRRKREPRKILDWGLTPGKYSLFLGRLSPEKGLDWVSGEAPDELLTNVMLFVPPSDMEGLSLACFFASFTAGETLEALNRKGRKGFAKGRERR
jgi:hypothetical protein